MARIELDLGDAVACAETALEMLRQINGWRGEDDPDIGQRRSNAAYAEMSRQLLHSSELLRTAASDCQMAYWTLKGHPDPR